MLRARVLKAAIRGASLAIPLACGALSAACSSDDAPEPEPKLETPGAFVAVQEEAGGLTLQRTLDTLSLQNDTVVFLTIYDVNPPTFEAAREMAKDRDIPIRIEVEVQSHSAIVARPYRVVWFRTLTDEEKERLK